MGIDIAFAVERRESNGAWARIESVVEDPYAEPGTMVRQSWYDTRNYECFFLLAGIQSSARRVHPPDAAISPLRGLPDDASDETRSEHESYCEAGEVYGASCLSARDLVTYDWFQDVQHSNCAGPPQNHEDCMIPSLDKKASALSPSEVHEWVTQWGMPPPGWHISGWSAGGVDVVASTTPERLAADFLPVVVRIAALSPEDLRAARCVFWFYP